MKWMMIQNLLSQTRDILLLRIPISKVLTKKNPHQTLSTSDKIDKIVTNRLLALPIFVLIMWFVYYISVSTVGDWMTSWVNDVLFTEIIPPVKGRNFP